MVKQAAQCRDIAVQAEAAVHFGREWQQPTRVKGQLAALVCPTSQLNQR